MIAVFAVSVAANKSAVTVYPAKIEQADMSGGIFEREIGEVSHFRRMWIRFFEALGRVTYSMSDDIVALYEANRLRQINDGAPAERTSNIPNGIDVQKFAALRPQRPATPPPIFCLIGRVVPIKDIKSQPKLTR